jgi:hypothetical protein
VDAVPLSPVDQGDCMFHQAVGLHSRSDGDSPPHGTIHRSLSGQPQ